jgi:glycosyltransferase involved in cell wall biosynthesis
LTADEGFGGRDIAVVPNGIDVERWAAAARRGADAARRHCGLSIGAPILGSVGRLHPVKNQQLLVRALAILRRRIADAALVLIGDGPQRDELAALARRLGVADAVHFLGERRDVEQILPAFDVFCLSSLSEGIPLTVLEAMAARVAVVAVAAGGVREAVAPDEDALLIDGAAADAEQVAARLASASQRLLGDAALRQRLTEHAAVRVQAEFTIEAACRRYRTLLQAACA